MSLRQLAVIKEAVFPSGKRLHHGTPQSLSDVAEDLGSLTREYRRNKRETTERMDKVVGKVKTVEGFIKGTEEFLAQMKKLAKDTQEMAAAVRGSPPCSHAASR